MIKIPLLTKINKYIFGMMKTFGVYEESDFPQLGDESGQSYEQAITPIMNVLSRFRDQVKEKAPDGKQEIFRLADELRDDILPFLGIRLEDRGKGQEAIWKLDDKEQLL